MAVETDKTRPGPPASSGDLYRRIFESASDGLLVAGYPDWEIEDANPSLCLMAGSSRAALVGRDARSVGAFAGFFGDGVCASVLAGGGVHRCDGLHLEASDGRRIPVEIVCTTFHHDGRMLAQCGVRDMTMRQHEADEVRRVTENLEHRVDARTAELEAANRELEAFTYSVSHDLRAPLRHILGFVDILKAEGGLAGNEMAERHLATIAGAARRMGELIDDLLDFSRIGRSEMRKVSVPLRTLVDEAMGDVEPQTAGRSVEWTIGALPEVEVDRSLMRQALVNLLSNAVKFTSVRDRAAIAITATPEAGGGHVVHVRDNGIGFDQRHASRLFGVFERLHANGRFEGTGIGLANVQRIIRRHGGRIWAEGKQGEGAVFHFSLPAAGPE
jgi:PAS domain S-box-containing protein